MIKELLYQNRTCRSFDATRKVTPEELTDMVACARLTPSTGNLQPLCYRLVSTPDELSNALKLTKWAAMLPELHLPPIGHEPTGMIVICQNIKLFPNVGKFDIDVGLTALAISLSAAEKGLASCMIANFKHDEMKTALSLSEDYAPILVIAVGKPDEERRIVDVSDGSTRYYRDENNVHCVPKRPMDELIIG